MTIVEVKQGHIDISGLTVDEARARLEAWDASMLEKYPHWRATYFAPWRVVEVNGGRAPWGNEWYAVGEDGRLSLHSADYDSSG